MTLWLTEPKLYIYQAKGIFRERSFPLVICVPILRHILRVYVRFSDHTIHRL